MTQINSQQHRGGNTYRRVHNTGSSRANDLMEVHPEAKRYHGSPQKILRKSTVLGSIRMGESKSVEEPAEKSDGRRNETGSGKKQAGKKDYLRECQHPAISPQNY